MAAHAAAANSIQLKENSLELSKFKAASFEALNVNPDLYDEYNRQLVAERNTLVTLSAQPLEQPKAA